MPDSCPFLIPTKQHSFRPKHDIITETSAEDLGLHKNYVIENVFATRKSITSQKILSIALLDPNSEKGAPYLFINP